MNEMFEIPQIGDIVRIERISVKNVPTSFITLRVVDIMKSDDGYDDNPLLSGVAYPFNWDGAFGYGFTYSFFKDNLIKNYGQLDMDYFIENYPEYII